MQAKAAGRPIEETRWTNGHADELGASAAAFAVRAITTTITAVEARLGTGHTWEAGTVTKALRALGST